jgi:hypothetical protein
MCESVEIRYAHFMSHPDYPKTLKVGCVCAENMEQDYTRPKERERRLRSVATRRSNWKRKLWQQDFGSIYADASGFRVTVLRTQGKYRIDVIHRESRKKREGKKWFDSEQDAMDAAFDALLWAEVNLKPP